MWITQEEVSKGTVCCYAIFICRKTYWFYKELQFHEDAG